MPAPPRTPTEFNEILELIWWRLDRALDLDLIYHSAKLSALTALEAGCTAVIDHHESPNAIEGSLSVIADACAEVGVRVNCAYGVTDRHGPEGAAAGLAENDRFLSAGGIGKVGSDDDWLIIHGVHLPDDHGLSGTMVHNPRSNMNNGVGYANPSRFTNPVALGTDGIGCDMLDEFRVAFVKAREADVTTTPDIMWGWLETGYDLFPGARNDVVTWNYDVMDPWRLAYTTAVAPRRVEVDGEVLLENGVPAKVDADEIKAKASEAAVKLFAKLDEI